MNATASGLLAIVALFAGLDWFAVARDNSRLEYIVKPLATVTLLLVALSLDVPHGASFFWRIAALAFCVLGDVFLMLPKDSFIQGLASFAVAQVLFTVSFATGGPTSLGFIIGALITVPIALFLARRFVSALRASGRSEYIGPVVVYVIVISVMAILACASGPIVAIVGAAFFLFSDSLIAESRFVRQRSWHPVGIMVTYHVALAGLVLGLL